MNHKEAVRRQIPGEGNELSRRKALWERIDNAYEQGGEEAIKAVLVDKSDSVTKKFDELLGQLRKKL